MALVAHPLPLRGPAPAPAGPLASPGQKPILAGMTHLPDVIAIVAAGLVMLALGLLVGHSRSAKLRDGFRTALDRAEAEYQRVVRALDRMKTETRNLSNFMVCMPEFAQKINTNLERSGIGPMIVGTLDQMFSPRQIVVFYTDEKPGGDLVLVESKGVTLTGRGPIKVKPGAGRIGWVAEHLVSMELDEFQDRKSVV